MHRRIGAGVEKAELEYLQKNPSSGSGLSARRVPSSGRALQHRLKAGPHLIGYNGFC